MFYQFQLLAEKEMNMKYYLKQTTWITSALFLMLSGNTVFADGYYSEDTDLSVFSDDLLPDEQNVLKEDSVATVTADGDFLLPTYMLPGETAVVTRTVEKKVVQSEKTVPVQIQKAPTPTVITTLEKNYLVEEKGPVLETKPVVRKQIIQQEQTDLDLLVQQTKSISPKKIGTGHQIPKAKATAVSQPTRKGKLLIPLAQVPDVEMEEPVLERKQKFVVVSEYADQMANRLRNGDKVPFLMPQEMRIKFYPNESAVSGQTLKWVKAFGVAALQDPRLVVEIRTSCAQAGLQDKRILLLENVLKSVGLSQHQIIVSHTNRPIDTMLLRAIPAQETAQTELAKKDEKLPKSMARVVRW